MAKNHADSNYKLAKDGFLSKVRVRVVIGNLDMVIH